MKEGSALRAQRLREFEDLCRRQGLPLTVQRRTILEAVLARADHPTAERVFEAVQERLPGVSRTTVYRVLETLVRLGVINRICHPGAAARFDREVHQHHHLVCLHCDQILDLEDETLNTLKLPAIDTAGYEINEFQIHLRGTCPDCKRKMDKEARQQGAKRVQRKAPGLAKKIGKTTGKQRRRRP
jgi:Fur family peroxide stress response transcriptional regulator